MTLSNRSFLTIIFLISFRSLHASQILMPRPVAISDSVRLQAFVNAPQSERSEVIELATTVSQENLNSVLELKFLNPQKKEMVDTALCVSIFGDSVGHADRVKLTGSGIVDSDTSLGEIIQEFKDIDFAKFGRANQDRINYLIVHNEIQDVVQAVKKMKFTQMANKFPNLTAIEVGLLVAKISLFEISDKCLNYAPKHKAVEFMNHARPYFDLFGTALYAFIAKKIYDTGRVLSGHPYIFTTLTILGYPFAARLWRTYITGTGSDRARIT